MIPNKEYDLSIFTQEASYPVDAYDLDTFIADAYGLSGFEGTLESSNDSTHECTITGVLQPWHADDIKEILVDESCECWKLHTVLDDLCAQGIIPAGKYYIRVCW